MGIVLYGTAIRKTTGRGDVQEMRNLLHWADEHAKGWGNVPVAVELLRAEISKAEAGQ